MNLLHLPEVDKLRIRSNKQGLIVEVVSIFCEELPGASANTFLLAIIPQAVKVYVTLESLMLVSSLKIVVY